MRLGGPVCLRMPIVFTLPTPCWNRYPNAIYIIAIEQHMVGLCHRHSDHRSVLQPRNLPAL